MAISVNKEGIMILMGSRYIYGNGDRQREKRNSRFFFHIFAQAVLFIMLSNASIQENSSLLLFVVFLSTIYSIFTDAESLFSFVVGISIFDYAFNINGMNATVIPTGILLIKLLKKNKLVLCKNTDCFISMIILLVCELIGDFNYNSAGEVFLTVVNLLLFIYLVSNLELLQVDVYKMIILFATPCFCAIYCMLSMYGNLGEFFQLLFTSSDLYRFGIGEANVMGGAMSLPLYALLLLSMTLSYIFVNKHISVAKSVFFIAINVICIFFAFLTISRSLYLGMGAILLAIILGSQKYKKIRLLKLFAVLLVILAAVLILYSDIVEQVISLLFNRLSTDQDGAGRTEVWESCFTYLMNHPLNLLVGNGACKYPTLDKELAAGAHNLLLDILMSWGILGVSGFFALMSFAFRQIKTNCQGIESMSYIPLYAIGAFSLTALRTNSLKTWSFLLVAMLVIQSLSMKAREQSNDT